MTSRWDELERWMEGQRLPRGFEIMREPDWVEQYVRRMMTKALPEAAGVISGSHAATCKEGKKFFHVKIKLPDHADKALLRLRVREDRLIVDGLPDGNSETVKLSKLVLPRSGKASVRDGYLYIKLAKRPIKRFVQEIKIGWQ